MEGIPDGLAPRPYALRNFPTLTGGGPWALVFHDPGLCSEQWLELPLRAGHGARGQNIKKHETRGVHSRVRGAVGQSTRPGSHTGTEAELGDGAWVTFRDRVAAGRLAG